jgi:hypothetical protein
MNNVPSKYIKRLRILTDEMCNTNDKILLKEKTNYRVITK